MRLSKLYFQILQEYGLLIKDEIKVISSVLQPINARLGKYCFIVYNEDKIKILGLLQKSLIRNLLPLIKYSSLGRERMGWYAILVEDIIPFKGKSPSENRKNLVKGQSGLTVKEGLWLCIAYPSLLKKYSIDLLRGQYGKECVPTIYKWKKQQFLSAICPDVADPMCGSPIISSKAFLSRKDFSNPDVLMRKIRRLYKADFK